MSNEDDVPGREWLMCNACCRPASVATASLPRSIFYLTKCGHIFCYKCLVGIASAQDMARNCLYCKKEITICKISRNMPPTAQLYFRCPKELLAESMAEIMQVIKFQTMHAARLAKRFNVMRANYEKLRQFCYEILRKKATLERELLSKVGPSEYSSLVTDRMTTPSSRAITSVKSVHVPRSVETPKTSVTTTESMSKTGTESSVIGNSTCSLNETVVVDMAKISVENSIALLMSHARSINLDGATVNLAKDVKEFKAPSTAFFAEPQWTTKCNRNSAILRNECQTVPRKRQMSGSRDDLSKGSQTVIPKKTIASTAGYHC